MLAWLKSRLMRRTSPPGTTVFCDDTCVTCVRPDGESESVSWSELQKVEILTTDEGPFQEDVYWLLHGQAGGCAVPQGAEESNNLLTRLQQLPGFNNSAVIEAMRCTDNRRFLCWERNQRFAHEPG